MELAFNITNIYCHKCGKICSNVIRYKSLKECDEFIKKWMYNPYCIDCCINFMNNRGVAQ